MVTLQVQKFGSVNPNTVGTAFQALSCLVRELNVAHQIDACSVDRLGRKIAQFVHTPKLREFVVPARPLVLLQGFRIGIDNQHAGVTINNQLIATLYFVQKFSDTDNTGQVHGGGNDCSVAGPATSLGRQAFNHFLVERRRLAGRQIVRQMMTGSLRFLIGSTRSPASLRRIRVSMSVISVAR